jgi:hypothetical protein
MRMCTSAQNCPGGVTASRLVQRLDARDAPPAVIIEHGQVVVGPQESLVLVDGAAPHLHDRDALIKRRAAGQGRGGGRPLTDVHAAGEFGVKLIVLDAGRRAKDLRQHAPRLAQHAAHPPAKVRAEHPVARLIDAAAHPRPPGLGRLQAPHAARAALVVHADLRLAAEKVHLRAHEPVVVGRDHERPARRLDRLEEVHAIALEGVDMHDIGSHRIEPSGGSGGSDPDGPCLPADSES